MVDQKYQLIPAIFSAIFFIASAAGLPLNVLYQEARMDLSRTTRDSYFTLGNFLHTSSDYTPSNGMLMKTEFESVQPAGLEQNNGEQRLFEEVFPDPFAPPNYSSQIDKAQAAFKPSSMDIDELLKSEWIGAGLSRDELRKVALDAKTEDNTRKNQLALFLAEHFDDVTKLSTGDGDSVSSNDLNLYGQLLKVNESSADPQNPDTSAWKGLHFERQLSTSLLPPIGGITGIVAADTAKAALLRTSLVSSHVSMFKTLNPRAGAVSLAGGIATWVVGFCGGMGAGDFLNRAVNTNHINRHFHDEAVPAMKRLMNT